MTPDSLHGMNRRKILLVSNGFYPEISPRSFRATELAKEFYRQGHDVTVISKYRSHDYTGFLEAYPITFKMWERYRFPDLNAGKPKLLSFLARIVSRLLLLLFEYPGIEDMFRVRKVLRGEEGYDLMISFAVPFPVHWGVSRALSRNHKKAGIWIADCGDPFMFSRLETFRKPFYFKYMEVDFCKKCDYLAVPFEDMRVQFYPQFHSKIKVIPQGFDFNEIRLYNGPGNNGKPVFMFAGSTIPGKRDLSAFLEFLSSFPGHFLFVIYTNQKERFEKFSLTLGEKLEIREYIDRLSLLFEMSKADFLVNVDTVLDSNSNIEAVPSKLIDYALTNRPILNISSSSPDEEMIQEFLEGNYSRQRMIDKANYDIRTVSRKFLELITESGY